MGKNDDRKHVHDLAVFALKVLKVLEEHKEWSRRTPMAIASLAFEQGLADCGPADGTGHFVRLERGKEFKDTWYGSSSEDEEAPRVGDHIERDLH